MSGLANSYAWMCLMRVRLAIANRRAKRLAAGVVSYNAELGAWRLVLYTVVNGSVGPFAISHFDSIEQATQEANDTLKVKSSSWQELDENEIEGYILSNAKNRWSC